MDNQNNDSAFWGFVVDFAIIVAALALYSKTQEVMTALAPVTLFGQTGLSLIYGFAVAALIEGVLLALHFLKKFEGNMRAEIYKWFLFGISFFCQYLDKSVVKDTANLSQTESFFAFVAIAIVPAVLFGLLWVKGGSSGTRSRGGGKWKGVRRSWKEFLDGTDDVTSQSTVILNQTTTPPTSANGNKNKKGQTHLNP